jgi:hypothetical protein
VFYSIATHGGESPDPLPGSDGWFGSGCSPGPGPLPDGVWFGAVRGVTPSTVTFDLACVDFLSDHEHEGDWRISNDNPRFREVPVAASARFSCLGSAVLGYPCSPDVRYEVWMRAAEDILEHHPESTEWNETDPLGKIPVWLFVNDGVVTEIYEPALAG